MIRRLIPVCLLALFAGFHSGAVAIALALRSEPLCRCPGKSGSCCCRRKAARGGDSPAWRAASCCGGRCRCVTAAPWPFRVAAPAPRAAVRPARLPVCTALVIAAVRRDASAEYPAFLYQRPPPSIA